MNEGTRIQKALADAGFGSRREIEKWISDGRVTVNGTLATLGQRIDSGDRLTLDSKPVRLNLDEQPELRVIAYNKPEGEICSRRDPERRPSVFDALPRLRNGRWVIVGRLDLNTSGLLLATNWGELANRLMHPGYSIEREYLSRVLGKVDEAMLARLRQGVLLEDGEAAFDRIAVREDSGDRANQWYSVVLSEGRNREVRRLWESQGVQVSRLKRIRFGPVSLTTRERRGKWRDLEKAEITALCDLVGLRPPRPKKPAADQRRGARNTSDRRLQAKKSPRQPVRKSRS